MPNLQTKHFGDLTYTPDAVFDFPAGIPGFESEQAFVFVRQPQTEPLMFMQSIGTPGLCFIVLPVFIVDSDYHLTLEPEELSELRLPLSKEPRIGKDILCGALVCAEESASEPTANLLAPIVLNLREHVGMQVIQSGSRYSHQHSLSSSKTLLPC